MKLELSKQYPFDFVALAFEILREPVDNEALAKFNAVEVDKFLNERYEAEREAVEVALGHREKSGLAYKLAAQKKALSAVVLAFRHEYLNGRFGMVSLADYDNLAMSWPAVEEVISKIDRCPNELEAFRRLQEVRTRLAGFKLNVECYRTRRAQAGKEVELSEFLNEERLVCSFKMDSYGRQLLMMNGLETVDDLTTVTADYLLNINDFGAKRLENVRENLKEFGIRLLGE